MNKYGIVLYIAIVLAFVGCGSGSFLLPESRGISLAVETVESGRSMDIDDEIFLVLHTERLRILPTMVRAFLYDSEENVVSSYTFEGTDLSDFPAMPLANLNMKTDIYSFKVELLQENEIFGEHNTWFFYVEDPVNVQHVTINPYSVHAGDTVEIVASLEGITESLPYVQFRMNNEVYYQDQIEGKELRFEIQAPETPGAYDLRFDIYPWFDSRITDSMESSSQYSLALLVLGDTTAANVERRYIPASDLVETDENLLYYHNDHPAFMLNVKDFPAVSTSAFEIGDGNFMLSLNRNGSDLEVDIRRGNLFHHINTEIDDRLSKIGITYHEGENYLILSIFGEGRQLYSNVIPYARFVDIAEDLEDTIEFAPIIEGLKTYVPLGEIVIHSVQNQKTLAEILEGRHDNLVLYAEGFESPEQIHDDIEFSENAYLEEEYLILPPDAWVHFPTFVLDEYPVMFSMVFRLDDDLGNISLTLLQYGENDQQELFTISGNKEPADSSELDDFLFNSIIDFTLYRQDESLTLEIQDSNLSFPADPGDSFRLYLEQDQDVEVKIHIDSIVAVSEVGEVVKHVLNTLP